MSTQESEFTLPTGLVEKAHSTIAQEQQIRESLSALGVEFAVADAVRGYTLAEVPFIYRAEPHDVYKSGVTPAWAKGFRERIVREQLWIGTTVPIHDVGMRNPAAFGQSPEVIVQWCTPALATGGELERTEAHWLADGRCLRITYQGISAPGAFDGAIHAMTLFVPDLQMDLGPTFGTQMRYRAYEAAQNKHGQWQGLVNKETSYTVLLDGHPQMMFHYIDGIQPVKEDHARMRVPQTPQPPLIQVVDVLPTGEQRGVVAETNDFTATAQEVLRQILPQVLGGLPSRTYDLQVFATATIRYSPERIVLGGQGLQEFSNEQRFALAQRVGRIIKGGHLADWVNRLQSDQGQQLVAAILARATASTLDMFQQTYGDQDWRVWLQIAHYSSLNLRGGFTVPSMGALQLHVGDAVVSYRNADAYYVLRGCLQRACLEELIQVLGVEWLKEMGRTATAS